MSFDTNAVINFGKHKGRTWVHLSKDPEGRTYLEWLMGQPVEGKYKNANIARNKALEALLRGDPVEPSQGEDTPEKRAEMASYAPQILSIQTMLRDLEKRMAKVEVSMGLNEKEWTE